MDQSYSCFSFYNPEEVLSQNFRFWPIANGRYSSVYELAAEKDKPPHAGSASFSRQASLVCGELYQRATGGLPAPSLCLWRRRRSVPLGLKKRPRFFGGIEVVIHFAGQFAQHPRQRAVPGRFDMAAAIDPQEFDLDALGVVPPDIACGGRRIVRAKVGEAVGDRRPG